MPASFTAIEDALLTTSAGRAVFDAIVQSNLDLRSIPQATIDRMLATETQRRLQFPGFSVDDDCL